MIWGPCKISDASGPKFRPEAWNSNASIFFVDQPIGVGFSYAEHGESVVRIYCFERDRYTTVMIVMFTV